MNDHTLLFYFQASSSAQTSAQSTSPTFVSLPESFLPSGSCSLALVPLESLLCPQGWVRATGLFSYSPTSASLSQAPSNTAGGQSGLPHQTVNSLRAGENWYAKGNEMSSIQLHSALLSVGRWFRPTALGFAHSKCRPSWNSHV